MNPNYKEILDSKVSSLTDEEKKFISEFGFEPVLRKLLSADEIKMCNILHKKGFINKGKFDVKGGTVFYQVESFVFNRIY